MPNEKNKHRKRTMETEEFSEFVSKTCKGSGEIIKKYFEQGVGVDWKKDNTPVTVADKESEQYIRNEIISKFPGHGIIGEEHGSYQEGAEYTWVIDPIDGTKSFIAGTPLFGTLMALLKNGQPIFGAMHFPIMGDLLIGDGHNAYLNGANVCVSQKLELNKATVLTTDYNNFKMYKKPEGFEELLSKCGMFRTWGDCFGYYLVATGKAHIMIDPEMSVWDKMALIPIIRGAGGEISDFFGRDPVKGDGIVAGIKELHSQAIQLLSAPYE